MWIENCVIGHHAAIIHSFEDSDDQHLVNKGMSPLIHWPPLKLDIKISMLPGFSGWKR